ncbi:uncharacterized protein Dwil_GK25106 [Drosophila willistoni]|uniref:Gamma-tubulin complex component n=1 Tax=Drosophila willistoni TaxID=7260 RepID=B4NCC7_DROWI|nr:gamma-tubulin complex component 2 homolog isoform X2 [Drosophila willistoni]EDW82486.1 uncharacterized protein Dwil_GK25106 [Drosophila willistoni]
MNSPDPVRLVLGKLIAETKAPHTPDSILNHFRATDSTRLPDKHLLRLLKDISYKRPNFREIHAEVTRVIERKDPMYALLVFADKYSDDNLKPRKSANSYFTPDMRPPHSQTSRTTSSSGSRGLSDDSSYRIMSTTRSGISTCSGSVSGKDIPTSTPVNLRKTEPNGMQLNGLLEPRQVQRDRVDLSLIKERVLNAVSEGSAPNSQRSLDPSSNKSSSSSSKSNANVQLVHFEAGLPDEYRTHQLWNYCVADSAKGSQLQQQQHPELGGLPLESQQRVILAELIYCLSGVRGNFIVPHLSSDDAEEDMSKYETTFTINVQLDKSLIQLIDEILPLASHFAGIQKIMAANDNHGQVHNALNSALMNVTHDYYMLLTQTELEMQQQELTLQKLVYYLRPTIWVMEEVWATLAQMQLNKYQGAAVLSHLYGRIKALEGDKASQEMIINLTQQAAVPYMRMLQLWIQKGIILDRNLEFLVEDNEVVHHDELPEHYSDDYWEKRYTVRDDRIPSFLEKYADKILRTGKYLNVIRQCGKRVMAIQPMDLQFNPTNEQHVHVINDAYYFAARMLLDVLLTENDLMGHLQSVKRYLLLNQGDFTMQFMDACEDELSKNVDQVLPMTLENLLGLTLRLSSARNDPYKDDLHCELLTYDLVTQMSKIMNQKEEYWQSHDRLDLSGLECFAFTYEVNWPVSLVLNRIAISKYQMLFRQLFYCKHVERQLCKIWKENSMAKKFSPLAAELYRSAFTLRQRMMNAIQNIEYYMMIEIIEPNWHIFIEKMKKVENVDNVLSLHQDFLDSCLKNCMLTESSHLNRAIFKLCKVCLKFCEFIQRSQPFFEDAELKSMVCDSSDDDESDSIDSDTSRSQMESSLDPADTFGESVRRFDLEFTGLLIGFLKQVNDLAKENTSDRFMNLVHRINFNTFYSEQMEKLCMKDVLGAKLKRTNDGD